MKFSHFASYLQKTENTSKRLEITKILAELIENLETNETDLAIYMSLGYLQAPFESKKFNIADKMMIKAIATAYKVEIAEVEKLFGEKGDLGDVCETIRTLNNANTKVKNANGLTITQTHEKLMEIAQFEGSGSQDKKIGYTAQLLAETDPLSAKYIARIVLNTTRLGFTELTVIDALVQNLLDESGKGSIANKTAQQKQNTKDLRTKIEGTYNIHPDIGLIVKKIKQKGLKGIDDITIEVGVPIKAQKPQRISSIQEIIEKMHHVWAEYKFDGTRVQLHLDRNRVVETSELEQKNLFENELTDSENQDSKSGHGAKTRTFIKTYTRNLEETSYQYPDLVEAANLQITAQSVILDGEAVGYDKVSGEFLPFQEIMQRKRKHDVQEMAKEVPLKYFVFDILYLDGKTLTHEPLTTRREVLKSKIKDGNVIVVDEHLETESVEELSNYFEIAREKGLEGLIVKKPDAPYMAGARAFTWVKYKVADDELLDDTVDCVVLGYYFGKGVRTQFGIGGFLVGVYDENSQTFKTLTKVGTGLKDEDWVYLKKEADKLIIDKKPANVELDKRYTPDVWVQPKIVVELGGDEISKSDSHTANFALRFPRLIKFRTDKKPEDATTVKEISDLHKMQKRAYI